MYLFPSLLPIWNMELISQFLDHFKDGRTPWTGDQLVARQICTFFSFLVAPTLGSLLPLLERRAEFPQFLDQGQ
jgi:hypothetical protein